MIFEGEEAFGYAVKDVWSALHDVKILSKAIPGCKAMTAVGDNSYVVALSLGVAAVKGEYEGRVKVTDDQMLVHYVIEGDGKGAPGFVKLRMDCWFESQPAGTLMKWKCDATVGGLIASIGGKVLSGISKFMAQQFFRVFKEELKTIGTPTGDESMIVMTSSRSVTSAAASREAAAAPKKNWLVRLWSALWRKLSRR